MRQPAKTRVAAPVVTHDHLRRLLSYSFATKRKYKGFSKLPEEVQKKMDPALAERYEDGGAVKMGSGGGVCKGMGIARAGGKFKVR